MSKPININDESYKKFKAALILTGEEEDIVLEKLINEYALTAFQKIMSTKAALESCLEPTPQPQVAPDQNPPKTVTTISANEQKQLFVNWFRSLTRNGKPYNPVTISGYTGRIENACFDPAFNSITPKNLFTITDLNAFLTVQKQIKACPGYADFDAKSHNGFTAALRKYEEFLRFQSVGATSPSTSHAASFISTASSIHRWTVEEDYLCCRRFLECYVIHKTDTDTVQFLQSLSAEVPNISEGSLRMKIQNIKYLAVQAGLKDTCTLKWLSQYSMQCERTFKQAMLDLKIR